jgi:hypothetical protein
MVLNQVQVNRILYLANKTTPLLIYQTLPLAKEALLSRAHQRVIIVAIQSPAQVMLTVMHTIYLGVIYRLDRRHHKHPQLNHLSHHVMA